MSLSDDISKRIKERRVSLALTQSELAKRCIPLRSRANISDIECGRVPITIDTVQDLAHVLYVDSLWLILGEHVTVPAEYLDYEKRLLAIEEHLVRQDTSKRFERVQAAWKRDNLPLTQIQRDALLPGARGTGLPFDNN